MPLRPDPYAPAAAADPGREPMAAPRHGASVAILDGPRVLLIERAFPPFQGCWTLPGGTCEAGEPAASCARREIAEELALTLGALAPLPCTPPVPGFVLDVFWTASHGGELRPNDEVAAWRWLLPAELGTLRTTDGLAGIVARALALRDAGA